MNRITFLSVLITMFSVIGAYAQVGINTENPSTNAALQVEPSGDARTVMFPKLTDGEGQAIVPVQGENGMVYFNTTTGCFHYYSEQFGTWLTMCGTPPPAKLEFNDCGAIKVNGVYIGGMPLTPSNYISVPVTVVTPGTYEIMAEVMPPSPNEGAYFFYASGTFNYAGTFVVNLTGTGTPTVQTAVQTDNILMAANRAGVPCTPTVTVLNPQPSYRIISVTANPNQYPIGIPLNSTTGALPYFATVELLVSQPGMWQLTTSNVNGYSFSGQGDIATASGYNPDGAFPQIVTVQVPAHGSASAYNTGTDNFTMADLNSATPSTYPFNVQLAAAQMSIDCSSIDISNIGTLQQNTALDPSSQIAVNINVLSTGTTDITASFAGVVYKATLSTPPTGTNSIILSPATTGQKPNTSGTNIPISFNLDGGGSLIGTTVCNPTITIAPSIPAFTSITANPATYAATVDLVTHNNSLPNITLQYTANTAGTYTLSTTANGVTYSATGNVQVGSGTITLTPTGTPTGNGNVLYTLNYDSNGDGTDDANTTFTVVYQYRTINVLGLGFTNYAPLGTDTWAPTKILTSASNFGPTGTYCVGGINIVNGATNQENALINSINNNKIDVIIVGWGYDPSATSAAILTDFVRNKKGVLMFCDENTTPNQTMLNTLYSTSMTVTGLAGPYSCALISGDDPILNGVFGDVRGGYLGQDAGSGWQYPLASLPASAINLATGNSGSAMFRDNAFGFLYVGDGGWMTDGNGSTSTGSYPVATTGSPSYMPVTKLFTSPSGVGTVSVANSIIYANAVAWAIDYVMQNINPAYQVDSNYNN